MPAFAGPSAASNADAPRARSLASHLLLTWAGVVLPILAMVGYLLWVSTEAEWRRMDAVAVGVAGSVVASLDRDLSSTARALEVLAASVGPDATATGFADAMARLSGRMGAALAVVDGDGRTVAGTTASPAARWRASATDRRLVGPLFPDPALGGHSYGVSIPVALGGANLRLVATVPAARLGEIVSRSAAPQGWFVTVVDADGHIVARNSGDETLVGRRATQDFLSTPLAGSGNWEGRTIEGTVVRGAYANSDTSGWRVAVGVEAEAFAAAANRSLGLFAGLVMVSFGLSAAMGWFLGRRLTHALGDLSAGAATVGGGGIHEPVPSGVAEVDMVGLALAGASVALRDRSRDLASSELRFQEIASAIKDVFRVFDGRDGRTLYASPSYERVWGRPRADLMADASEWDRGIHAADRDRASLSARQGTYELQYRVVRPDGGESWIRERGYRAGEDAAHRMVAVCFDVSRDKAADDRQSLMMRELHHRVKNTLATVLSIARQTARSARDLATFEEAFYERIRSLARTHTLLMGRDWESICLRDLVDSEVAPYAAGSEGRASLEGPRLALRADAAFALGMAIHELATNAAKHGAWSVPGGSVHVAWRRMGEARLRLVWSERGGPAVAAPSRKGFGSQLLGRVLGAQMGATVRMTYEPPGFRCEADIPLEPNAPAPPALAH